MKVLKFGGSSVAHAENIKKVSEIILQAARIRPVTVVVSAMGGITDMLLRAADEAAQGSEEYKTILEQIEKRHLEAVQQLIPVTIQSRLLSLVKKTCNELEELCSGLFQLRELTPKTKDRVAAYGEWLSSQIIAGKLQTESLQVCWHDSRQLIKTNSTFTAAAVDFETTYRNIRDFYSAHRADVYLFPGFIASDKEGHTTTLGRGGSDYTAALFAAALDAEMLEIWTDVSGMMTADPRWVPNARIIPEISYQEAMELSHFGAKVIYPPTLQPAMVKKIPVLIKNTFAPNDPGTLIHDKSEKAGQQIITGISSIGNLALITLEGSGMVGIPGFSKRLFEALSNEKINVILITQASSEHSITVGIDAASLSKACEAADKAFANEIALGIVDPVIPETGLSIVALVGDNMKNHTGISGRMFGALGRNGINVRAIAQGSSEKNISAVIASRDVQKALNVLHEEFFETTLKEINLYITGTGNVGSRLLHQLLQQKEYLKEHLKLELRVVGLANSRKMIFDEKGIDLQNWKTLLQKGRTMNLKEWTEELVSRNLRNAIMVDITASSDVAGIYSALLRHSISVVACNKTAASSSYSRYRNLKKLSAEYNCHFLFETNVGAGLPVIATLNDLVRTGDRIHKIEAVLSGTLNYVFNHYDGSRKFADVVRQAQQEGYTEPDPRLDLSGTDVMRKILILAREAGFILEPSDVEIRSFLPEKCLQGSVDDFYKAMAEEEKHFHGLLAEAKEKGCKLKFVAKLDRGKASVGLEHIYPEHDFYHLFGKDNVVLFYTDRYQEQPLVIKGAGAGADVTASGIFADILRAAK
ncbi:MAG: bifunctional aspartate kinase/homoserine dehydrogenase I [Chitinophagaceae bacterium]|nr:bifunctional aspartate kinase/homoserine dehydrogenase I [Chitinophagaceae bacterium]